VRREQLCCIQGVVFWRSSLIQNELCWTTRYLDL
jgi:hypothetical protein